MQLQSCLFRQASENRMKQAQRQHGRCQFLQTENTDLVTSTGRACVDFSSTAGWDQAPNLGLPCKQRALRKPLAGERVPLTPGKVDLYRPSTFAARPQEIPTQAPAARYAILALPLPPSAADNADAPDAESSTPKRHQRRKRHAAPTNPAAPALLRRPPGLETPPRGQGCQVMSLADDLAADLLKLLAVTTQPAPPADTYLAVEGSDDVDTGAAARKGCDSAPTDPTRATDSEDGTPAKVSTQEEPGRGGDSSGAGEGSVAVYRNLHPDGEEWNVGSALHPEACVPCAFYCFKRQGCEKGTDCAYCHMMHIPKQRCRRQQWRERQRDLRRCSREMVSCAGSKGSKGGAATSSKETRGLPRSTGHAGTEALRLDGAGHAGLAGPLESTTSATQAQGKPPGLSLEPCFISLSTGCTLYSLVSI